MMALVACPTGSMRFAGMTFPGKQAGPPLTTLHVPDASGSRMSFVRRPVLEMPPVPVNAADPASETISPGAEFEPVSPLDVPAFLRRQNEA